MYSYSTDRLAMHQILQIPVMPDATGLLQTLDTHFFASLKKNILIAKAQVHEQEEAAFRQLGVAYQPLWGPPAARQCPR